MRNLCKLSITTVSFLLFLVPSSALAQIGGTGGLDGRFEGWLENLLLAIIAIAGIVAVAVLIFNAFLYITASGDEGKVQKATKGITYAIVGLIIAAIAFMIVNFVIENINRS